MQKRRRDTVFSDKALQSYLAGISQFKTLSREDEQELAIKAQKGDQDAISKLIQSNLKFVVKIATRFQNRGLTLSELISEGNIGLIKAIDKFDPSKEIKLISYAIWWIKQRIMLAVSEKNSLIRIPMGKSSQANKLRAVSERLYSITGINPSDEELSELMEVDEKMIDQLRGHLIDTMSLDDVITNASNQEVNISENIEDKGLIDPQRLYYRERMQEKLENAINRLEPREAVIIRTYFGLNVKHETKNFAQIAEEMGLSRERVRQIQKEALKKIVLDLQPHEEKYVDAFIEQYDY